MADIFKALASEFPHEAISWRAQSVTKDGTKAMALAYIDARDVMRRLDDVCTPAGWQCRYPHADKKTICEIGIKVGDEWVWKANGAGDTDIEAEKGAVSDAFKRAAVLWGIGRYLYDMPAPWVPCETSEYNGKKQWKRWTEDPWKYVKGAKVDAPKDEGAHELYKTITREMERCDTVADLERWAKDSEVVAMRDKLPVSWLDSHRADYAARLAKLKAAHAGDKRTVESFAA